MANTSEMKYLYHYYESTVAPFLSFGDLSYDETLALMKIQGEEDPNKVYPIPNGS
jgi:hypothetical protein